MFSNKYVSLLKNRGIVTILVLPWKIYKQNRLTYNAKRTKLVFNKTLNVLLLRNIMNIHKIATHLNQLQDETETGFDFDCTPIDGDIDVLQVEILGREEIPIFLSISDNQILCIAYLWGEDEVKTELKANMMEAMLEMNIPMPLSAFAKVEDKYVVFGALSINSTLDDIELEIVTLSDNSLEVISEMDTYLK